MTKKRLFTNQELEQMGARTSDLIDAAIDSGNLEKAKSLNHRMYQEGLGNQDFLVNWVAALLSHIYQRYGDEAMYQALYESFEKSIKPVAKSLNKSDDLRKKAEILASSLRVHLQPLKIEEDDEKITFMMQPCGTGARLVLGNKYELPFNLAKIKKAQPMTFNREDFPVYCTHCAIGEIIALELTGLPLFDLVPGQKIAEEMCRFHIYKDPEKIPARFYEMFGKKKQD